MQVARNSFLVRRYHGRSLRRKLIELRLSRLIERELTKKTILEHYLNVIYLGNGVYGVEAASRDLFGKSVGKVTLTEARCSPRSPRRRRPTRRATIPSARASAATSCSRSCAEEGFIDAAQEQRRRGAAAHRRQRVAALGSTTSTAPSTRCARSSIPCCPTFSRTATSSSTRRSTRARSRRPTR